MNGATITARGCGGSRKAGGAYMELGLSEDGLPVEAFLFDPVKAIDNEAIGLSGINQVTIEQRNIFHVVDWIGKSYYPNVADWIEEVRRFGVSQRLLINDYSQLSEKSTLIPVHAEAYLLNELIELSEPRDKREVGLDWTYCTREAWATLEACHPKGTHNCAGQHWDLIIEGKSIDDDDHHWSTVKRDMPSFSYMAYQRPPFSIETAPGMFARFPIERIAIVYDPIEGKHETTFKQASKAKLPVVITEA